MVAPVFGSAVMVSSLDFSIFAAPGRQGLLDISDDTIALTDAYQGNTLTGRASPP